MKKVMKDTFFEVLIQYPKNYMNLRKLINSKNIVVNLRDKKEHIIHIRNLKQALN